VEKDAALARRFQPVYVAEPTVEDTISILRGLKEKYEKHHNVRISDAALVTAALLGAVVAAGIAQGRQGRGDRPPDAPLPNIREYKPTSTLVVPEHLVPRAKFPVVDFHGHPPPLTSPDAIERVVSAMDPLNLRVMVVTGNPGRISREQMRQDIDVLSTSKHKDRFAGTADLLQDTRSVLPDAMPGEQGARGAGVLAGHQVRPAQRVERARAGIGEVADRRGDDVEGASHSVGQRAPLQVR